MMISNYIVLRNVVVILTEYLSFYLFFVSITRKFIIPFLYQLLRKNAFTDSNFHIFS